MAVDLCDFALHKMVGGEIFIEPNMAMPLIDLYKSVYGEEHEPEYYDYLLPGEKYHECLLDGNESGCLLKGSGRFVYVPMAFPDTAKYWKQTSCRRFFVDSGAGALSYKLNSFEYVGKDDLSS